MSLYKSKPQTVQAMQWTGENWGGLKNWFEGLTVAAVLSTTGRNDNSLKLQTEIMDAEIAVTDWVICNENGAVFMANDAAFKERYEISEEVLDPEGGSHENPLGD